MKLARYKETPDGIMNVLDIFTQHKLSYILFKCEHIFAGKNKNLDILFETNQDYKTAATLLKQQNFCVQLSEKVEKYKTMYCGIINNVMYSIHLHREVAWHGIKAMDKKYIFERKVELQEGIIVPSKEDYILIHAGHVLFENFKVTYKEKKHFKAFNQDIDLKYINSQLKNNHWKNGFYNVIKENLSNKNILISWSNKVLREPATFLYLTQKAFKIILRKLSTKRNGCLISFIGVNGTGKSTMTRKIKQDYEQRCNHLGIKSELYYFGWNPTFVLTKIISSSMKKRNKQIFKETALKIDNKQKFNVKQEILFLYQFLEYSYRYLTKIRPKLRKGRLMITDRYFYDIYGQYPYSKHSIIFPLLLKIFPKPDYTFLLDAKPEELQKRGKIDKTSQDKVDITRKIYPLEYLQRQRENYLNLINHLHINKIDTERSVDDNSKIIINRSWRKLI
jgi:thymidylate kinase